MFNTYPTPVAALAALAENGLGHIDREIRHVVGGLQPILLCVSLRDAEEIQSRGFNARLAPEFDYE